MSSICRVNKSNNFTVMSNYHLRDENLSLKAVGLLSKVLALPDDWHFSIEGLTSIVKEGKSSVAATLSELEKYGYLVRNKIRDASGRIICTEYIFYEIPQNRSFDDMNEIKDIRIQNEDTDGSHEIVEAKEEEACEDLQKTDLPYLDNQEAAQPYLGFPELDNRAQLNTNNIKYLDNIYLSVQETDKTIVEVLKEQIDYKSLILTQPDDVGLIDDCINAMAECLEEKKDARIGRKKIPYRKIKQKFKELRKEHMCYIINSINQYAGAIRNVKSYLLTVCYNVPDNINPYMLRKQNPDKSLPCMNSRNYDFEALEKQLLSYDFPLRN